MSVRSQTDAEDMRMGKARNTTLRELLPSYGWTDAWFARVFLPWLPVRESRQETEALRNFARWEHICGGQPQNA
jgi:hypothetical protein